MKFKLRLQTLAMPDRDKGRLSGFAIVLEISQGSRVLTTKLHRVQYPIKLNHSFTFLLKHLCPIKLDFRLQDTAQLLGSGVIDPNRDADRAVLPLRGGQRGSPLLTYSAMLDRGLFPESSVITLRAQITSSLKTLRKESRSQSKRQVSISRIDIWGREGRQRARQDQRRRAVAGNVRVESQSQSRQLSRQDESESIALGKQNKRQNGRVKLRVLNKSRVPSVLVQRLQEIEMIDCQLEQLGKEQAHAEADTQTEHEQSFIWLQAQLQSLQQELQAGRRTHAAKRQRLQNQNSRLRQEVAELRRAQCDD